MKQGKSLVAFTILSMAAVLVLYFSYYVFNALKIGRAHV